MSLGRGQTAAVNVLGFLNPPMAAKSGSMCNGFRSPDNLEPNNCQHQAAMTIVVTDL